MPWTKVAINENEEKEEAAKKMKKVRRVAPAGSVILKSSTEDFGEGLSDVTD
jgi:hypothetical protein